VDNIATSQHSPSAAHPGGRSEHTLQPFSAPSNTGDILRRSRTVQLRCHSQHHPAWNRKYGTFGASLAKTISRHTINIRLGTTSTQKWDGVECGSNKMIKLFTQPRPIMNSSGPIDSGFFFAPDAWRTHSSGPTKIHLSNNYKRSLDSGRLEGPAQSDHKTQVCAWDYDSAFKQKKTNVSAPAWGLPGLLIPKTVVRGSFGLFYDDHFRLGLVFVIFRGLRRRRTFREKPSHFSFPPIVFPGITHNRSGAFFGLVPFRQTRKPTHS